MRGIGVGAVLDWGFMSNCYLFLLPCSQTQGSSTSCDSKQSLLATWSLWEGRGEGFCLGTDLGSKYSTLMVPTHSFSHPLAFGYTYMYILHPGGSFSLD